MNPLATLESTGRVATLTLRREDARNALSIDLLRALHARLDELAAMHDTTVLILTGSGRAFCAGMDLKAVTSPDALAQGLPLQLLTLLAQLTLKIRALPAVTIASVNGAAVGGGCGLSTACDISLSHADAKLGFPEVDLGVCPAVVAPWLVRKVGPGKARRILLSGGLLTGEQAHAVGLIDLLVPAREDLSALTADTANRLAAGGPLALRATKDLLNQLDGSLDEPLLLHAAKRSADVLSTPEAQAMLRAKLNN